jgi:hypothetical protein
MPHTNGRPRRNRRGRPMWSGTAAVRHPRCGDDGVRRTRSARPHPPRPGRPPAHGRLGQLVVDAHPDPPVLLAHGEDPAQGVGGRGRCPGGGRGRARRRPLRQISSGMFVLGPAHSGVCCVARRRGAAPGGSRHAVGSAVLTWWLRRPQPRGRRSRWRRMRRWAGARGSGRGPSRRRRRTCGSCCSGSGRSRRR